MDFWAYWKVWLSYIDPATNQECDLVLVENPHGEKAGEWGKNDFATYWMGAEEDDDGNIKLSAGYNRTFPIGACCTLIDRSLRIRGCPTQPSVR